jgi:hypothetical protein
VVSVAHHVTPTGAGRKPTARNRKEKAGAAL